MRAKITMKDGTVHNFESHPRPGGSYSNRIEYRDAFVVHIDEWGNTEAFPAQDVAKVETFSDSRGF